jgi:predicted outer membrane protein
MKKHLLPALISLAFLSPFAVAEQANPAAPSSPPAATTTMDSMTPMTGMAEMAGSMSGQSDDAMMQKRMERRKEMQALRQKIQEAKTTEERQKLMEEQRKMMQSHHEAMRKEIQEMQDDMSPPPWAQNPPPGYGPRMARPQMNMNYDGAEMEGFPPPPMMYPRHRMNNERGYGCKMTGSAGDDFQQHQATMEKRMENIEKLLEKIADSLAKPK